ncbi:helix-turn-helix domain-containing protein [Fictibacillus norfolkensis]|uniref:Helix-turn-helix transcriptional regulator n=1 Tax=Fictibacillus norfolkensis TaxID=2762233 RepID=A0ABR8SMY5_9BACL|nr:helix-turn-helix transcriptional regulator [Fictibacillus norfolkensis]MBD7964826.1 helix-turn-helix transcriptional regulator [Fictibacillus norfolkensis]
MNLGEKIRYFRKVKNLSQQELSAGICSVPYLSKIENGVTEPSEEIQQHLAARLEIRLNTLNENELIQRYIEVFYALYKRDHSAAEQKFHALNDSPTQSVDEDILHKIFKSIYIMMTTLDIQGVQKLLTEVGYIENVIKGEKAFYYLMAKGQLSYFMEDYEDSFQYFLLAEKQLDDSRFQDWEKGYLLYMIGLSANQLYKNIVALEYTQLALAIFERSYFFERCADCRIILAIIHLRIKNFDESTKHLWLAETIANNFNNEVLMGVIYHNLGSIATHKGETEKAIELYTKSLEAKKNDTISQKLSTIYMLLKEYQKSNSRDQGVELLDTWLNQLKGNALFRGFELHFIYYKQLFTYGDHNEESIRFMVKELIPYFEQRNEWIHLAEYYPILGKYFEKNQKYKQASMYYSLAYHAVRKMHEEGVTYV